MIAKHKEMAIMNARKEIFADETLRKKWMDEIELPSPMPTLG